MKHSGLCAFVHHLTTENKGFTMSLSLFERVNMMLSGKFCIDFGSKQVYTTKHCAEPFEIFDL